MFWYGLIIGVTIGVAAMAWCAAAKDNKDDFVDFQQYLLASFDIESTEEDVADDE